MTRTPTTRERPTRALDRLSVAALEARTTDELLGRIAAIFQNARPAADGTVVLVERRDLLEARAATGENAERAGLVLLRTADVLGGRVPDAWARGFGRVETVPLGDSSELVGVVLRGWRGSCAPGTEERSRLSELAERAASAIRHRLLLDELEEQAWALRASEAEARRTAAHLTAVISAMAEGVIVRDTSGGVSLANGAAAEILGIPHEELCVMPFPEFLDRFRIEGPDGTPEPPLLPRALAGETVDWTERVIRAGESRKHRLRVSAAPVPGEPEEGNEAVIVFTDVTAQRRAEDLLRLLADTSRVLVDASEPDEMLWRVAELSVPVFADVCAVDLVESDGLRPVALAHADPARARGAEERRRHVLRRSLAPAAIRRVAAGRRPELHADLSEEALISIAEDARHVARLRAMHARSAVVVPIVVRGEGHGAMTFIDCGTGRRFDAADLSVAEELAHRVSVCIANLRLHREAREATRARENVLAIVSHDLRSPLSTIRLAASVVSAVPETPPAARKQAEAIERAVGRMTRLIGDLLDFARIQFGRLALEPKPEKALAAIDELVEAHVAEAAERGIRLVRELALPPELRVLCDRDRLHQVMGNLIGNAAKVCNPGDTVLVAARQGRGEVLVKVQDPGPGVPPEELPHVFEAYRSGDARTGVGLGLFITKGIVEAHGGRIWVESLPGHGCTVTFTIPALP